MKVAKTQSRDQISKANTKDKKNMASKDQSDSLRSIKMKQRCQDTKTNSHYQKLAADL